MNRWLLLTALATLAAVIIVRQRQDDAPWDQPEPFYAPWPEPEPEPAGEVFTVPDFTQFFAVPDFTLPETDTPIFDGSSWSGAVASSEPNQLASPFERLFVTASETVSSIKQAATSRPAPTAGDFARLDRASGVAAANERAILDTIAVGEGTSGPNGYTTLFGGGLFTDFSDHPRQRFSFTNKRGEKLWTTAAGRYQFLIRTWDALQKRLGLPDFGPESQDAAALELIRERGALADVRAGRITAAIKKIAPVWASLPGAGYAQREEKLSAVLANYQAAGGTLEA